MSETPSTSEAIRQYLRAMIFEQKRFRSVNEFATASHLSQAYLSQMLTEHPKQIKNPSAQVLDKLAHTLGVETWELIRDAKAFVEKKTIWSAYSSN